MSNKDLLKQAIAEAKTIREAAITNAKEALEESLTPHLKEMLAQKLQEMEDSDDEMEENIYEAEEEEVETEEGEEETEEGEEEDIDVKDMSVEELKDLIRDIVSQEVGTDQEAPEGVDDMEGMDSEEEIDINELLAELAEMENNYSPEDVEEAMKEPSDSAAAGLEELVKMLKSMKSPEAIAKIKAFVKGLPAGAGAAMRSEEVEEGLGDTIRGAAGKVGAAVKGAVGTGGKFDQWIDKSKSKIDKVVPPHPYVKQQAMNRESVELNEALQAVKTLRTQLQEVNLLNAKLLYVNKVFKANNLTEGQKVNVVAAFDKAETVREVKLVFETVSKNVVTKPVAIKEHRSFASKATGNAQTTAPKQILTEVDEQVQRWQKLAGIIKS